MDRICWSNCAKLALKDVEPKSFRTDPCTDTGLAPTTVHSKRKMAEEWRSSRRICVHLTQWRPSAILGPWLGIACSEPSRKREWWYASLALCTPYKEERKVHGQNHSVKHGRQFKQVVFVVFCYGISSTKTYSPAGRNIWRSLCFGHVRNSSYIKKKGAVLQKLEYITYCTTHVRVLYAQRSNTVSPFAQVCMVRVAPRSKTMTMGYAPCAGRERKATAHNTVQYESHPYL
jgi:hypothetical protein